MKLLLTAILFIISSKFGFTESNNTFQDESIRKQIERLRYDENYQKCLDFIKKTEGYKNTRYDDRGYDCIGYGQRIAFYSDSIPKQITEKQANIILVKSFNRHIEFAKANYPELNQNQILAVALMSYKIGIGRIINRNVIKENRINIKQLMSFGQVKCREFEIELFYSK